MILNEENFARSSACMQTQLSDNKQNFLKCLASKARPSLVKSFNDGHCGGILFC